MPLSLYTASRHILIKSLQNVVFPKQSRSFSTVMAKLYNGIPTFTLNDGNQIPVLAFGIGTALSKGGKNDKIDPDLVKNIELALKVGYRHLDAAESYGNEAELGAAIKNSKIPREELFVTTKLEQSLPDVEGAIDASLSRLGLDYVDLYLIHSPFSFQDKSSMQAAWKGMEAVQRSGKAKSIGVSNFLQKHLETVLETCEIKPALNQTEFHMYLQRENLIPWTKEQDIVTSAYGPQTPVTKAKPGPVDDLLAELAKKYGVDEGEICLRWCIDQEVPAITTSSKETRLTDYLRALAFKLTPKEVEELNKAGYKKHFRGFWNGKFDDDDRS